jgi:hypothetical protein
MGDNLHQRAIVREWMEQRVVYLETPWPSIYHDLVGSRLKLVKKATKLRTQAKNMVREKDQYDTTLRAAYGQRKVRVWYTGKDVAQCGSVLDAMCVNAHVANRDFRLPVPEYWRYATMSFLHGWANGKPLMVYRPLVMRTEWSGCAARNPDPDAYAAIFNSIRHLFYVVSVADLVQGVEWLVGTDVEPDLQLHKGELSFELLAGLMSRATLSYASPGFATILAQAVGTPSVCVFGGYENSSSFTGGARYAPYLGIDPIEPCRCFLHDHPCQKQIDVPRAIARITHFVQQGKHDSEGEDRTNPGQLELAF